VKTNRKMEALLDEIHDENLDDPKALPQKLLSLLNAGFVEDDECVFLSALKRAAAPVERIDFSDRTAYECFVNHIHVEDYLENGGLPPIELLGRGIALAHEIADRLARLHGTKRFHVIISSTGPTCAVRFHTVRPDESWVAKNLNGYQEEAVAVLDTQESLI
jgi:hypothetical protein